jgi:hypothetical protein
MAASREPRHGLTPPQRRQVEGARTIGALRESVNHGLPPLAATNRPGAFAGRGVVAASGTRGAPRSTAVAANLNGRGSSARSVDPMRTSTHIAAAPQASRTRQPVTYARNPAVPSRVAAQAPTGHTFNRPVFPSPSQYRANPPPSARSFPAQAPDRRWAESRMPHGNAASGANFRPARDAQPARVNVPAAPRNGKHS